jgi:hypothetical protein
MCGKGWSHYLGLLCILAATATISPGMAQNPSPAAPSAQAPVRDGCDMLPLEISTASIEQATGDSLQRKRWQPQGGVIQFTVQSLVGSLDQTSFFVCYRWKTKDTVNPERYDQVRPDRLDRNHDGTSWTVTTTIPGKLKDVPHGMTADYFLPLVPLADVRIIAVKMDKTLAAEAGVTIGVTHPFAAIVLAVATVVIVLFALCLIARRRLEHEGIKSAFWPLQIISTPSGYASLSQLQIMLWTLVVAASAVYVMALSGDLIEITNGTLVLLGIAGAAAIGAKAHTESQDAAARSAADTAKKDAGAANMEVARKTAAVAADPSSPVALAEKIVAQSAADDAAKLKDTAADKARIFKHPPDAQTPRWSDLIVNENTKADGSVTREIDVTRFQMLLFTLITAAFVLMNVLTTYVIPEIPTGFLTLMGISNGVYLGAKVTQGS